MILMPAPNCPKPLRPNMAWPKPPCAPPCLQQTTIRSKRDLNCTPEVNLTTHCVFLDNYGHNPNKCYLGPLQWTLYDYMPVHLVSPRDGTLPQTWRYHPKATPSTSHFCCYGKPNIPSRTVYMLTYTPIIFPNIHMIWPDHQGQRYGTFSQYLERSTESKLSDLSCTPKSTHSDPLEYPQCPIGLPEIPTLDLSDQLITPHSPTLCTNLVSRRIITLEDPLPLK